MPQVMPLAKSRARAEEVFVMREVGHHSWSKIRDDLEFKSIGAVQQAYNRYLQRNPMSDGATVRAGIVARKRRQLKHAFRALDEAAADGDYRAVARLNDSITRIDEALAKLFGLGSETVNVNATVTIAEYRAKLLEFIDAEPDRPAIGP